MNCAYTPLHTDCQLWRGVPANWQVMCCHSPSSDGGGVSLLVDTCAILKDIWRSDEAGTMHRQLLRQARRLPFVRQIMIALHARWPVATKLGLKGINRVWQVSGDISVPVVSLRGGQPCFGLSPQAPLKADTLRESLFR